MHSPSAAQALRDISTHLEAAAETLRRAAHEAFAVRATTKAFEWGYRDGFEGRLRPYELGGSIAFFDWDAYDTGRKAGEHDRKSGVTP